MTVELIAEKLDQQEAFRCFAQTEILPYADEFDRDEYMPPEMIRKVAATGYLGAMIPEKYGGLGYDNITIGMLSEELGRVCSSVRSLLTVHGMASLAVYRWGSEEQRHRWLPRLTSGEIIGAFALTEPNIGSDAKNVETTAVLDGGEYVINGRKKWITFGQVADVFLVFAQCGGKPTAFFIPRDSIGFSSAPQKGLLGCRGSMTAELSFDNVRIPQDHLIGAVGTGLSHVGLSCLDFGRYTIACGCVGAAQACLEASVTYATARQQFGVSLNSHQLIQKMITEMSVQIKAARLMCMSAGTMKDNFDPEYIMETWAAKYFASKMLLQATADAIQIHGANGISRDFPVERHFRDCKINEIIEGSSQLHEMMISDYVCNQIG